LRFAIADGSGAIAIRRIQSAIENRQSKVSMSHHPDLTTSVIHSLGWLYLILFAMNGIRIV
jgi:hypothetical protein